MNISSVISTLRMGYKSFIRNRALPESLICFVTNRCNLECSHCFYHEELNNPQDELTADEWDRIAASAGNPALILFTGGEPFLRTDFDSIVTSFAKQVRPLSLSIISNGMLPEVIEETTRKILSKTSTSLTIGISIDGPEQIHDKLRGKPGSFINATRSVELLCKLREENKRLNLHIATVFSSDTQENIDQFLKDTHDRWHPNSLSLTLIRGNPKDPSQLNVDISGYLKAMRFIHSRSLAGSKAPFGLLGRAFTTLISREKARIIADVARNDRYLLPCVAGSLAGVILPSGEVRPCEMLSDSFGNLRDTEYDIRRLWLSPAADKFRRTILENKCRCTHECFVTPSVAFSPFHWPNAAYQAAKNRYQFKKHKQAGKR